MRIHIHVPGHNDRIVCEYGACNPARFDDLEIQEGGFIASDNKQRLSVIRWVLDAGPRHACITAAWQGNQICCTTTPPYSLADGRLYTLLGSPVANIAVMLVVASHNGSVNQYDLGDYRLVQLNVKNGERMTFQRIVPLVSPLSELTIQHSKISEQWRLVQKEMDRMERRMRPPCDDNTPKRLRANPALVWCRFCQANTTHEDTACVALVETIGFEKWMNQWDFFQETLSTLERKLHECVVHPPAEVEGPLLSICKDCATAGVEDADILPQMTVDLPLPPFV